MARGASVQLAACPRCPYLLGGEGWLGTSTSSRDMSLLRGVWSLAPSAWKPHLCLQL